MGHPKLIDRGSVSGCTVNGQKVEKNGSQRLYQSDGIKFGNCNNYFPNFNLDPIEYKLQLDLPIGLPSQDDGTKSDLSQFDKRIELAKDTHPLAAFATMDHLDDSLDSSASRHNQRMPAPPDYNEDPKMKLRFDKFRPQDYEGKKFDKERKDMQAQLSSALNQ